jgi:hypothetical protein
VDELDPARRAAADWERIRAVMRELEGDPDWPRGLGDCELELLPDGTARWRFGTVAYALVDDTLAELRTDPTVQVRLIDLVERTVKTVSPAAWVRPELN